MTQEELESILNIIEDSFHRAANLYDLPIGIKDNAAYNASAKDGLFWSEPMRPHEIAEKVRSAFEDKIDDEKRRIE